MKQLGLGMRMYSQDYDKRAGAVSTWFCPNQAPEVPPQQGEGSWQALSLYYPYIKNSQIYRCPDQPSHTDYGQLVWNPTNGSLYNYFCTNWGMNPIPLLDMIGQNSKGPAGAIIIAEASNVWLWDWGDQNGAQSLWPRLCAPHTASTHQSRFASLNFSLKFIVVNPVHPDSRPLGLFLRYPSLKSCGDSAFETLLTRYI
jgi:hypothetical protein